MKDDDDSRPPPGAVDERADRRELEELEREAARLACEAQWLEELDEKLARKAERLAREDDREAERAAKQLEREAEQRAKEAKQAAQQLEREAEQAARQLEREAEQREREAEQVAQQREREVEQAAKQREREADLRERDAARREAEAEREAEQLEREAEQREAQAEREAEQREREAERREAEAEREAERREREAGDDEVRRWEQLHEKRWQRFERAWQRQVEKRARWEARHARHRSRWHKNHKRWRELHEEREMWMRRGDKRAWGPWWLQARMRRRIFGWLALAFTAGALVMWITPEPRWWHGVIALFGLSMMSGAIAFRLTRPLLMVVKVAQDIGDGKLETRLDVHRHRGETRLLAIAINEMAERIQQQLIDQRQLLAAVSHELRTPLGHMRVLIDTARDHQDRRALAELEREVLVLDDLVGRLLASSRLEFGNLDCRPTDLGELVSDVATAAGVAPEAIEAIGDVHATVDPTLVRRAVANLVDNARVHGGGAVAVRIERRARQVAIEVDDAGSGVPADRRADAFRAFVPSRAGGLGLGLALVSRIAVAHGGGAWITDRPGGGARVGFTVEIEPRPASDAA
jgi:signal transduction histidine kinase